METVLTGASTADLHAGRAHVPAPKSEKRTGAIKFAMPNPMNIHLHPTPAYDVFERRRRDQPAVALSIRSGCTMSRATGALRHARGRPFVLDIPFTNVEFRNERFRRRKIAANRYAALTACTCVGRR